MGIVQRIWTPDVLSESKTYSDKLHIYDAGPFVGYLTEKNGQKQWTGFSVVSRVKNNSTIEETLVTAHEFEVPMKFSSIETYPAIIESQSLLWIPGWKILLSQLHESGVQKQKQDLQQERPHQKSLQVQKPPFLPPVPSRSLPSFQHPQKSPSGLQGQSQRPLQNKRNSGPKPKALPSSNQVFHEKQRQSVQETSGAPPLLSSQGDHISPLSQWCPLSQISLSLPPPSRPEESSLQSTSSFQNQSSSQQHLPSQPAQHRRAGKSRRPIVSQPSSHG